MMLRKKALRKILITTFSLFTLFVIYLIPTKINDRYIGGDVEVEYTSNTTNQEIYLLGDNSYLVKFHIFLEDSSIEQQISTVLDYLKINSSKKLPDGLRGVIPEATSVLGVKVDGKSAILNFSKQLLEGEEKLEERMVEAIVYSVTALPEVDSVQIQVEGSPLLKLPKSGKVLEQELTRDFGINKVYDITNRNGIQKVTIYYLDKISNNNYYVPVTKYLNDDRDKIKIIIDNLASAYIHEENLMSYLNSKTTILDYSVEDNIFSLNLSNAIFGGDSILEEVEYTIQYSIFDNYDVDKVLLKVDGELVSELTRE